VIEADLVKMSPDLAAIEEYRAKAADYDHRAAELNAVTAQRDEVRVSFERRPCSGMGERGWRRCARAREREGGGGERDTEGGKEGVSCPCVFMCCFPV
jgi:hypothetical protein